FCSSRRRHTRCYRDWSSDVCSSDLARGWNMEAYVAPSFYSPECAGYRAAADRARECGCQATIALCSSCWAALQRCFAATGAALQIGRASCRERVYVLAVVG